MANLSYIVETNGDNGVRIEYYILDYVPLDVVWDETNTITEGSELPDVEEPDSPEYVRRMESGAYAYYRRVIYMPSKSATFSLYVLSNETRVEYTYEAYSSFLTFFRSGNVLFVKSSTNVSGGLRNGVISIVSNLSGETLTVPVVQEYDPVRLRLLSYTIEDAEGYYSVSINDVAFEHTFHWLTGKNTPDKEVVEISVLSTGPRNGYIIRDISEYAYSGIMDETYVYSVTTENYYQTKQACYRGNLQTIDEEIIFDTLTEGVYKKTKYDGDLDVVRLGDTIKITNYGRCFLQDDAYYIITLENVDDLRECCRIVIRYVDDDTEANTRPILFINPNMYIENGSVILESDNESNASNYFEYFVSFDNGQLVFRTMDSEQMVSNVVNNELIVLLNDGA